jgi:electron transport complex protein RnfD
MLYDPGSYPRPAFMLFSGGLMLGAVFMATDPVASPITNAGCWLYGILIGFLVTVIRLWGGMPEGVMYAILLANAVSPHIDRLIQPRVFGTGKKAGT